MPYDPIELKEISKPMEKGDDPTLKAADKTGGAFDEDAINEQYHPVIYRNEDILVRDAGSTLDWKNYRFEVNYEDGTHQEFVFTAKDDGAAQKQVNDRLSLIQRTKGTYKLVLVEAPKELFAGEMGGSGEVTVKTNAKDAKPAKETKKEARDSGQAEKSAEAKEDFKEKAKAEKAKK